MMNEPCSVPPLSRQAKGTAALAVDEAKHGCGEEFSETLGTGF